MADDLCGRTLGEFVLRERLTEGGCGTLYRCDQPLLKREAVVKVLREPRRGNKEAEARFLREARLASRLDHHYAAHVYAFGIEPDGLRWIAMELVAGLTLDEWLCERGPMSLEQFVPLFECIAEVVQSAHERGIVHRDLKPANVMVIEERGRLIPKLLDFGIAKAQRDGTPTIPGVSPDDPFDDQGDPVPVASAIDESTQTDPGAQDRLTPPRAGIGSAAYMSPEQWQDPRTVGPASDVYSLGILAYKALTGGVPFTATTQHEWRQQHLRAKVPPVGGDLPAGLDRTLQRALAKSPEDRHDTALALASELRAVLMASERELLRSLAQQWDARAQSPSLLLSGDVLAGVERWTRQAPSDALTKLECSYVAASQRRARRSAMTRRLVGAAMVVIALGAVEYQSVLRARMDEDLVTQAAVEQGQQALLHGESSDAVTHLQKAYQRGDHSPPVTFMLARALQPRMSELARFTGTSGRMWSAVFSPDGKQVLTADDKDAQMWDATSSQLLFTMPHGDTVYQAAFSQDGSRIATAGGDGTVRIWNATTGAPLRALTTHNATPPRFYAVAATSRFVAAIETSGTAAYVWDAESGTQLADLGNDASGAASMALSPDGRWLATSGGDDVRVFDTATWRRVVTIAGPRVRSVSFDSSGLRLAVGTYDGDASIWEVPTGVRLHCLRQAGESVDAVAFSRDARLVAAGSRDGTEQVWDVASGGLLTTSNVHRSKIFAIEFSSNGSSILSAGGDGSVVVSSVVTGMPVARLEGATGLIFSAHFDQTSSRVVGASSDGTARVWDTASPYRRWGSTPIGPECDAADGLVPDQRFLAISCRNHGTQVWDTAQNELLAELPAPTTATGSYSAVFPALTAAGDRAAIARGNAIEVYALPSGHLLRTITCTAEVSAVAFAPSGHDLISGSVDGSLLLTRADHDPVALPSSQAGIDAVSILADGRVIVADARTGLRVIDPAHGELLMDAPVPFRVRLLRTSPDGSRLVTISTPAAQAAPALWDLNEHRLVGRLAGHVGRVFSARFVAGGREILTAGADGTARLWDAASGNSRLSFRGDSHFLADAALAPDGSVVVAGGSDGFLRFWDAASGRLLWTLQAHKSYVVGVHYEGSDIVTRGFAGDIARWALPVPTSVLEACAAHACVSTGK